MSARLINQTFSGGEIDPRLHARDDIEKYSSSVAKMRNFYPTVHGSALRRPGLKRIGRAYSNVAQSRLFPFSFSDEQTYVIEISGAGGCRIITDGGILLWAESPEVMATLSGATTAVSFAGDRTDFTITSSTATTPVVATTSAAHEIVEDDWLHIDNATEVGHFQADYEWSEAARAITNIAVNPTTGVVSITATGSTYSPGDRVYLAGRVTDGLVLNGRAWRVDAAVGAVFDLDLEELPLSVAISYLVTSALAEGTARLISPNTIALRSSVGVAPDTVGALGWFGSPLLRETQRIICRGTGVPQLDDLEFSAEYAYEGAAVAMTSIHVTRTGEDAGPPPIPADLGDGRVVIAAAGHAFADGKRVQLVGMGDANRWLEDRIFTVRYPIAGVSFELDISELTPEKALKYVTDDAALASATAQQVNKNAFVLPFATGTSSTPGATVDVLAGAPHPYLDAELRQITYAQSADVLTLSHKNHPPMDLERGETHEAWEFTIHESTAASIAPPIRPRVISGTPSSSSRNYRITAIDKETGQESGPSLRAITAGVYGEIIGWDSPAFGDVYQYLIYTENNNLQYGLIGASNSTEFDLGGTPGITPEWAFSIPSSNDPFGESGTYPGAVGYFQDRIIFAGSTTKPQHIFLSAIASYNSFSVSLPLVASDSITARILSREVNPIRHVVGIADLYVLTSSGVWVVRGDEAGAITAVGGFSATRQSGFGASEVQPLQIGDIVVYVQDDGRAVRDLSYRFETDRHTASDVTVLAKHLFEGNRIVEWAFAAAPHSVAWAVLEDGTMLSLAYLREQSIFAWSTHDTGSSSFDFIESVAAVREGSEDVPYIVAKRWNADGAFFERSVERMSVESTLSQNVRDVFYVDGGLFFEGERFDDAAFFIPAPGAAVIISIPSHGLSVDDLIDFELVQTSEDGDEPGFLNGKRYAVASVLGPWVGIKDYDTGAAILYPDDFVSGNVVSLKIWKTAVTFSGLDHLNGREVSILHDGDVHPNEVISSGTITLTRPASRLVIGLGYRSDLETLEPAVQSQRGTLKSAPTLPADVILRVTRTRGGFMGTEYDRLTEIKQRVDEDYNQPIKLLTGELRHHLGGGWKRGKIIYRQSDPLPVEISAIIYTSEFGET